MRVVRNPTLWGAGALAIATIAALVASWLYVSPPGQKIVTFYTQDAASIRPGDEVRIAGIHVGKVNDLRLESNQVRVRARVDDTAFVGDQSQVEVRMLTVVGGYYVSILSLGKTALGAKPIPLERVTMPYNLMRTLTDATKITENVSAQPINEALNQVQKGLSGDNVQVVSAIIEAGNSVMSTIDKQRGQVTKILNLSDEYIRTLNANRDLLRALVRKAALMEQTLTLYSDGFNAGLSGLGDILDSLEPIGAFYLNHRDKFLTMVRDFQDKARFWAERNGLIIRALRLGRNKIERVLDAQNAPPELLATDLCMPAPGHAC
ncbi:MlaD family protein [Mycobacterium arosiense]|uniref:Mammalian cell entry protein n=1 Tax=Mycobacterium arosiense ATCC BAA-1401 = DSM 45069 TaxID=1265311 RepID=A0A1W9ZBJ1_MYCAI|nr:MlaD family protein [Mycobacterium arosiense]ORA11289.1 mammalian cell entry protein [Mycobacterium arosiense ATCC BAA-1401 = DSM 45069]